MSCIRNAWIEAQMPNCRFCGEPAEECQGTCTHGTEETQRCVWPQCKERKCEGSDKCCKHTTLYGDGSNPQLGIIYAKTRLT